MSWVWLVFSGLSEVAWASSMKRTAGFTDGMWTIIAIFLTVTTVTSFGIAVKQLPIGPAYAVWTATAVIGTAAVALVTGDRLSLPQLLCMLCIIGGAIGLKLLTPNEAL